MTWRSERLLIACRSLACQHCGAEDGTVCAAHSNWLAHGKGRGLKAPDYRVAALCFTCHTRLDQGKDLTRDERRYMWEQAHIATLAALFEHRILKVA